MRNKGKTRADPRFSVLAVMEMYGWTFEQYMAQPLWFYPLLDVKLEMDDENRQLEQQDAENKAKKNGADSTTNNNY